ncbi:MAG: hypothetical protein KDN19_12185 [Verrucomicrobiae bacterium]|nr:hypothetical protein [Verrucomicrobiae bacterium]
MKKPNPIVMACLAGVALACSTSAQENGEAPKDDAKPRPEKREPAPRPAPEKPAPQPAEGRGRPDDHRDGQGPGRPEAAQRFHEQMQGRMEEIQKLHRAGKHEEAEKLAAELKEKVGEMRDRFQGGDTPRGPRGPGGPPPVAENAPKRPPMEDAKPRGERPEEPRREEKGPDAEPKRRPGPPSEEQVADFRHHMRARMEEIQKLRQDGKPDEAMREMAELREHFGRMRSEFGLPADGPGGPPWMAMNAPKPEPNREAGNRGEGKGDKADRPDRGNHKAKRHHARKAWKRMAAHRRAQFGQQARMRFAMRGAAQGPAFRGGFGAGPGFGFRPGMMPTPPFRPGFGPQPGMRMGQRGPAPHMAPGPRPGGPGFGEPHGRPDGPRFHHHGEKKAGKHHKPGHHGDADAKGPKKEGKPAEGEACEACKTDSKPQD